MRQETKDIEATLWPNKSLKIWSFVLPIFNITFAGGNCELEEYDDGNKEFKLIVQGIKKTLRGEIDVYINDNKITSFNLDGSSFYKYYISTHQRHDAFPEANIDDSVRLMFQGQQIMKGVFKKD